jgi:hypothetical protein
VRVETKGRRTGENDDADDDDKVGNLAWVTGRHGRCVVGPMREVLDLRGRAASVSRVTRRTRMWVEHGRGG